MAQYKKRLDQLLLRFLYRKSSPKETSLLWQWLWQLDIPAAQTDNQQQERLWDAISRQTVTAPPIRRSFVRPALVAAAALLFCLAAIGWLLQKPAVPSVRSYVINSDDQHMKSVALPDGSTVILNLSSTLTYSSDYNNRERKVMLTGEGYFKVTTDDQRPFIVQSGGLETRVLGTEFNMEARKGAAQVRVALTAGKVAVYPAGKPEQQLILKPGELLRYEPASGKLSTTVFTNDVACWTTGGLSFNGIPLSEAIQQLETHYHIRIQYQPQQLAHKTVTASMSKTSWQKALSAILFPHDLTYKVKDRIIIVR
ncbi:FecR family protein [Chitinophaga arvensicola]|uniref:Ferric-dicitrate binding protein FerR, regulates iron transport through sigma-19 n=1 Tax=Chitinophaga arvensicola TaxID=29529 RepID=A0A1I0R3G6_9BACT|nr:FecR domain-containing protein [Chitinophaga arvensicola]SEW34919.1 ferric-dicitrate binding protein FerR, regulates iron transport through sigma-19 [Chitinophaga arvensicola]